MTQRQWIVYVRVSKVGDREGSSFHSPQQQEDECRAAAPGPVVKVLSDLDVSGTSFNRAGLNTALELLREDPAGLGIISYDFSRLGRNLREFLGFVDEVESLGGAVVTVNERIDTSTPEGRLMMQQFAGLNEFYSRSIGRRWKSVHARRLAKGLPSSGQPRFGYTKDAAGRFVPDPDTGPVLREMYLGTLRGESAKTLVARLNADGYRTTRGGEWTVVNFWRSLDSGFAAGLIRTADGFVSGAHEALITPEEWAAYQRRRESRRRIGPRSHGNVAMLTGLIYCGLCGGRMYLSSSSNTPGTNYRCSRYMQKGTCSGTHMLRHKVEGVVGIWLGGVMPTLASAVSEGRERSEERAKIAAQVDGHRRELHRLGEALVHLTTSFAEGIVPRDAYLASQHEIQAKVTAVEAQIREAEELLDNLGSLPQDVYQRLIDADLSLPEWNAVLHKVIKHVRIHPDRVEITPLTGSPVDVYR